MTARPLFLFAPGAGAPSTSPWMADWAKRLASLGEVRPFDYPYGLAGRKTPDRLPVLIDAHKAALAEARRRARGPIFLIGKSMGGRVGCHVALDEEVAGLICLGYPLRSGATGALRDQVLLALRRPVLFVQGTRDPLCPLVDLEAVRARMQAPNHLFVVDEGNHSLELPAAKRKNGGQAASDGRVFAAIERFAPTAAAGG